MTAPAWPVAAVTAGYTQVVVPVDFSRLGWTCLPTAEAVARAFGVPHRVVHVDTASPWVGAAPQSLTLLAAPGGRHVSVEVVVARTAADGILELLDSRHSPLLTMASHGHTALVEAAVGSTAAAVIRRWPGPVLLTGPRCDSTVTGISRVVAAVAPTADVPVALAADVRGWADRLHVPLEIVTVADDVTARREVADRRSVHVGHLADVARALDAGLVRLRGRRAAHEIVRYADTRPGTLLAVTSHTRPVAEQLLLGSVAKAVLRQARGPVLLRHA